MKTGTEIHSNERTRNKTRARKKEERKKQKKKPDCRTFSKRHSFTIFAQFIIHNA